MAQKRTSTEAELLPIRTRRNSKRSKVSAPSDSSEQSIGSVSEVSAMRSSPDVSEDTRQSSPPTQDELEDDSESTVSSISSDSSSSDESEDDDEVEDEAEEEVITLGGPRKPQIDSQRLKEDADALRRKLQAFMPKMQEANRELAAKGADASMEDVGEDERHIEMSLGLGVLEEQRDGDDGSEGGEEGEEKGSPDVMRTLMGLAGEQKRYAVEEVKESGT